MAIVLLCAALGAALLFPGSWGGRLLRRALELPGRLAKITPLQAVIGLGVLAVAAGLILYARTEGAMIVGQLAPEALAWFTMFDIAAYADFIAVLAVLAATVRIRAALAMLRRSIARVRGLALHSIAGPVRRRLGLARFRGVRRRAGTGRSRGREDADEPAPAFALSRRSAWAWA